MRTPAEDFICPLQNQIYPISLAPETPPKTINKHLQVGQLAMLTQSIKTHLINSQAVILLTQQNCLARQLKLSVVKQIPALCWA